MKRVKRWKLWSGIAFLLVVTIIFAFVSPVPASILIRLSFSMSIAVAPEDFKEISNRVTLIRNVSYPSEYKENFVDIYLPKNNAEPLPVVLWIHGGGFVGGHKEDVEMYAMALADEGIAVVCMDYRRAPEAKYPTPIIQTEDAYRWLVEVADEYSFDLNHFVLAGDSAGAHIAAQFASIQSNPEYADEMGFEQLVPLHTFRAILLFCGPFDVADMDESSNPIANFLIGKAAWAYFGTEDWVEQFAFQTTITNHITSDFPTTFITDGNVSSFEEHGRELADTLEEYGVLVETYFIPIDTAKAEHEYQFIMNTDVGKESFDRVVRFLREHVGHFERGIFEDQPHKHKAQISGVID